MALISYEDTDFKNLPDQPTLRAIFDVARKLPEADIARSTARLEQYKDQDVKAYDSRPAFERMFAGWMSNHKIITSLPDLDKDTMSRVIALSLIEGTALMANTDNTKPLQTLAAMRLATAQSAHASFFHSAIAEQEDMWNGKPWPNLSVAETEYRIIDMKNTFLKATAYTPKAEWHKAEGHKTVHHNEYRWWTDTFNTFDKTGPDGIPPTLYKQTQDAVEKLRALAANFKPEPDPRPRP